MSSRHNHRKRSLHEPTEDRAEYFQSLPDDIKRSRAEYFEREMNFADSFAKTRQRQFNADANNTELRAHLLAAIRNAEHAKRLYEEALSAVPKRSQLYGYDINSWTESEKRQLGLDPRVDYSEPRYVRKDGM